MAQNKMLMPTKWRSEHKLFPHQVGFTCPPFDYDAAPSDFLRLAPETVGVHGWMLHAPDYEHGLDQRKQNFGMMEDFVHCMSRNGVDVCGQVGSNWVHASGLGVNGIRDHCDRLSDKYGTRFHMAGYAMVEALRAMNVEKVALNAAYHWPSWWQGTVGFLREAGFDVLWAGNFHDQGWFKSQEAINDCRWVFEGDLAQKSFEYVAEQAPNADAYLINGMCNFRTGPMGQPQRPVHLIESLEATLGKPVIGHDTALYWRILKSLNLAPIRSLGKLMDGLHA
jgi:maleate cis-trans isomerase